MFALDHVRIRDSIKEQLTVCSLITKKVNNMNERFVWEEDVNNIFNRTNSDKKIPDRSFLEFVRPVSSSWRRLPVVWALPWQLGCLHSIFWRSINLTARRHRELTSASFPMTVLSCRMPVREKIIISLILIKWVYEAFITMKLRLDVRRLKTHKKRFISNSNEANSKNANKITPFFKEKPSY